MKQMIYLGIIILSVALVNAADVCVVVYYSDNTADSKCVNVPDNADGYEVMQATGFETLWTPPSLYGQMLCKINGVGTDVEGTVCHYEGEFWNFVLKDGSKWGHSPVGLNGGSECWNRDFKWSDWSKIVHYCAKDKDLIGFSFGKAGSEPFMLKIRDVEIKVDGKKESGGDEKGGSIDIKPGSVIKVQVEAENLYSSDTKIELNDIIIKGKIKDVNDDDIEEESNSVDISAAKDKTLELEFKLPLALDDEDYELILEVSSEDEFGIEYNKEITYDINVKKEKHEIAITNLEITPKDFTCKDSIIISLGLANLGKQTEDVGLKISNDNLIIEDSFKLKLETKKTYSIDTSKLHLGDNNVNIVAEYSDKGLESSIVLNKKECNNENTVIPILKNEKKDNAENAPENTPLMQFTSYSSVQKKDNSPFYILGILGIGIFMAVTVIIILKHH